MVRIAHERIDDLFALAARESVGDHPELADRYVILARKIGARYNVRLPPEYRELYCRGCSVFWVEGRTVRTRFRSAHRIRTCLACGRERRVRLARGRLPPGTIRLDALRPRARDEGAIVFAPSDERASDGGGEEE